MSRTMLAACVAVLVFLAGELLLLPEGRVCLCGQSAA